MMISRKTAAGIIGILLSIIIGLAVFTAFIDGGAEVPDNLQDPIQINLAETKTIDYAVNNAKVKLDLLAEYKIEAVVKGVKQYKSDGPAGVSPMDFILTWGNLSQPEINKYIRYSQSNRWYHFTVSNTTKIPISEVSLHSANTHIIPADEGVLKILSHVKKNDYVSMEGYLVKAYSGSAEVVSSLTREDSGAGACEVFYVSRIKIL